MSARTPLLRSRLRLLGILVAAVAALAAFAASAQAAPPPHWQLESRPAPTNLPLAHEGKPGEGIIVVAFANLGGSPVDGEAEQVKATAKLPAGLEITSVEGASQGTPSSKFNLEGSGSWKCSETSKNVVGCTFGKKLPAYQQLEIYARVKVTTETAGEPLDEVSIEGGGLPKQELSAPLKLNGLPTHFGLSQYEAASEDEKGVTELQAGSHPYQMTTTFNLNQSFGPDFNLSTGEPEFFPSAPALQRNLLITLPPGLIGNPNVGGQCPVIDFTAAGEQNINACDPNTAIGVATVTINFPGILRYTVFTVPVFNLAPGLGRPAQFAFEAGHVPVILNPFLRSDGDYGATIEVKNAPQEAQVLSSRVTIWGTPGDPSHNASRGFACLGYNAAGECKEAKLHGEPLKEEPFLTLPTSCLSTPTSTVTGETWPLPDGSVEHLNPSDPNGTFRFPSHLTGCDKLDFSPETTIEPTTSEGNTPTGLKVHVHVPQQKTEEPGGLAEGTVKATTVELPEGMLLSPAAANGLEACAEGETEGSGGVGFTGFKELDSEGEPGVTSPSFTRTLPSPLEPGKNFCPNGSKVGVVKIFSPDLAKHVKPGKPELEGGVYLATQNENPFGSLFAMYLVATEPESGVVVKFAGEVHVDPETGKIVSTFKHTPQVPFEDLRLELFGGPRASVTTPAKCGTYETKSTYETWSGTLEKPQTVTQSSPFTITSGPGGAPCSSPQPFSPTFTAGSTNNQAGAYTPFELTLGHPDTDQAPTALTVKTPSGLAAMLSHVELCQEPQASEGTCGSGSLIGHATASAGLGNEPFTTTGGQVFITGPYNGAPFGLSVVVPTKAGPFDFGNVVTRSTINVDRNTGAVTIGSVLPTKVETVHDAKGGPGVKPGVPVQLKQIHVVVDRPEFEFNPTNCNPLTIEGSLTGEESGTAAVSSGFQVQGCAALPFTPKLTATAGKSFSRVNGINFKVVVESAFGQDNIGKSKLVIPEQLPSRLTTIQKACIDSVFNANPAGCPEGSNIGHAVVHTPVLKNPLTGPAYLVSHGGAAFPDVEFVLQGEGILLILDGKTNIHNGVTTSTFEAVPDAPVDKFEAIFPEGPHSALTGFLPKEQTNMCGQNLKIPTTLTGQNGVVIQQNTPVAIEGLCKPAVVVKKTKLQIALEKCKKLKKKSKRVACEKAARKKYGPHKKSKKAAHH